MPLVGAQSYQFFLFNDILLYASASRAWNRVSYKMKHFHPLTETVIDPK